MKKIILIASLVIALTSFLVYFSTPNKKLETYNAVGNFSLVDSQNNEFTAEKLKEKVWIADFIFTSCQGPCPLMTQKLARLHKDFKDRDDLAIVTVTVDPETDTPEVLQSYADKYEADINKWHFLTGERENIRKLMMDELKLGFAENIMFHSDRIVLIDKKFNVRGYYSGSEKDGVKKLKRDLSLLLK